MRLLIIKLVIVLMRFFGVIFGVIFSVSPLRIKKNITILLKDISIKLPKKISMLIYNFSYELVKKIYARSRIEVLLKRSFKEGFVMMLDVTKKTQRSIYLKEQYEPPVLNFIKRNLKLGGIFIDIGSNVGFYSLLGSKIIGSGGLVLSFEPESYNFSKLKLNIDINNMKNIQTYNKAIGAFSKKAKLHINPFNEGGHSLESNEYYYDNHKSWKLDVVRNKFPKIALEQDVDVVSLDNILRKNKLKAENINLIKIDIEGHELSALMGMRDLLKGASAPNIICEVGRDYQDIKKLLTGLEYELFSLNDDGSPSAINTYSAGGNLLFIKKRLE